MSNYNCENCGANIKFNPSNGMMECEHCGTSRPPVVSSSSNSRSLVHRYSDTSQSSNCVATGQVYLCSSCGAKVNFQETETKKRCPSCGDVALNRADDTINVPDGVIPFTISREQAGDIFREWIATRKFAPRDLKQMAKNGKISGYYVPAWNFNFKLVVEYSADVTRTERRGDQFFTRHFYVDNADEKSYANVLISANKRMVDTVIDELEPFDMGKMIPYSSEYIYGFSSLGTDEEMHEKLDKVLDQKRNNLISKIRGDLKSKYETIESFNSHSDIKNKKYSYTYVPVWANHYTYNGKKYHCYINGQTGKTTGKAPKSFWKIFSLFAGICAAAIALFSIIF